MTGSIWCRSALTPSGWADDVRLVLADGRITEIADGVAPLPGEPRLGHAVPGLPNLHSHAFQRAMAGLTERSGRAPDSFWTWRARMYGFLDRLDPDDVEAVAGQAYVEMLESGFTRVGEFHYLHHDRDGRLYGDISEMAGRIAAAAAATGIGLTLLPVFYAQGGFGAAPATEGQRRFINDLDGFTRLHERSAALLAALPGAVIGLAPHSLRAVTPEQLAALEAAFPGMPLHIHVSEQVKEVEDCLAWSGKRPVQWLLDHAGLSQRWCLIHATHADALEIAGIAARGAVVGLCPITEANLGDGLFDMPAFQAAGGFAGVGSDSNVLIEAGEELRLLEYGQRLRLRARTVLAGGPERSTGRSLHAAAVAGGNRALGAEAHGLIAGAPADFVTLDAGHAALAGRRGDDLLDGWIFAARATPVDTVWCAGRQVVADGRHPARDSIRRRFDAVMAKLLA